MPDEPEVTIEEPAAPVVTVPAQPEAPASPASTLTLEDALKELASARKEAAKYRVGKKETEHDLNSRIAALENEVKASKREAIAAKYNLPAELAARLHGDTPEEIENDAKALAVFAPKATQTTAPVISATAPVTPARLTPEVIKTMTPDQINANWDAVSAALKGQ